MWCAVTATVHFSAAASTLASNSRASDSPLAPIVLLLVLVSPPINERGPSRSTGSARQRVDRSWAMAASYSLLTAAACQPAVAVTEGTRSPGGLALLLLVARGERPNGGMVPNADPGHPDLQHRSQSLLGDGFVEFL